MSRVPIAALLRQDTASVVDHYHFEEYGWTYYKFKNDMYMFPADDVEFERLDVVHSLIYKVALRGQRLQAVMKRPPRRILDVGFGTGFWMLDMEGLYPTAEIIGLDIEGPPQGVRSTQRTHFKSPVDFNAPTWPIEECSVDLIHMGQLLGCVPNWLDHYCKAYRYLRPGGHIEHVEIDWKPQTYTGHEFPPDALELWHWWGWMEQASKLAGKPLAYCGETDELLEQAGFVQPSHMRVRVPLCADKRDERDQQLAHGYQMTMGYSGSQSFTGMSMALFTRYLNMSPHFVEQHCAKVLAIVQQKSLPLYINLHVWTARKPSS